MEVILLKVRNIICTINSDALPCIPTHDVVDNIYGKFDHRSFDNTIIDDLINR